MDQWINKRLTECLGFPVPIEMINYILNLKEPYELDDYFGTLLDFQVSEHRLFLNDLKQRMFNKNAVNNNQTTSDKAGAKKKIILLPTSTTNGRQQFKKQDREKQTTPTNSTTVQNNSQTQKQQPSNVSSTTTTTSTANNATSTSSSSSTSASGSTGAIKKKTKYVNLYTKDGEMRGDIILLKGRHPCTCQAAKHKLINNCMKCGRIVCEQEGSGPCFFCGNLICSEDEQKIIESSTKKGEQLRKTLMQQELPKGHAEAMAMRNRLLEYDRTSEKRTTVIDDESDYFKTNSVWLSQTERDKLQAIENRMQEQKHGSRLTRKVTLDFTGRQIVDERSHLTLEQEREMLKDIENASITVATSKRNHQQQRKNKSKNSKNNGDMNNNNNDDGDDDDEIMNDDDFPHLVNPFFNGPAPIFDMSVIDPNAIHKCETSSFDGVYNRVQDKQLLEISDLRNCLSMHQPWASLLVAGIKMHEGRSWYTAHRGRLWIAATSKPVDMHEVKHLEEFYQLHYDDDKIEFPTQYPSGCLLGCVLVQDCLPQEEYRKQYPQGESDSPFVFICTDPQELPVRFPIKGMHKIYKIDPSIHTAAVKSLQRMTIKN